MKKLEAKFQAEFIKWIKVNPAKNSTAYEYKYVPGSTFNLSGWVKKYPHQIKNLYNAKHENCYHKISDQSMGQKPFDAFVMANADAFLVIWFEKHKKFGMIEIDRVIRLTKTQKSISFSELKSYEVFEIPVKKTIIKGVIPI